VHRPRLLSCISRRNATFSVGEKLRTSALSAPTPMPRRTASALRTASLSGGASPAASAASTIASPPTSASDSDSAACPLSEKGSCPHTGSALPPALAPLERLACSHSSAARAGNRRFGPVSALRAHTKTDLLWETLRALNRPGGPGPSSPLPSSVCQARGCPPPVFRAPFERA
jgi:hypothetical protein